MISKDCLINHDTFHAEVSAPGEKPRCDKWRRNGRTKTWKRDPGRIEVPVKYGLRGYSTITAHEARLKNWHCAKDCPYEV